MRILSGLLIIVSIAVTGQAAEFELASPRGAATILVPAGEPAYIRLAAADLAGDVAKITGQTPAIVDKLADCKADCVVLASADQPQSVELLKRLGRDPAALAGKWEAYTVDKADVAVAPIARALIITGSDARGTMFGLYAFIEQQLGVDPLYFWTGRAPKQRASLAWEKVHIEAGEPKFRFRGWFINDEDLLTEWEDGGGQRDLDYAYYHQVMAPKVSARVFEALLRLQYNLVIPSSFVDIRNPAEARLIDDATRRGLLVSQHHVEPLGVSGFAFRNYWKSKGEDVPFSFTQHPEKFEIAWREYASLWAKYPGVIWQLGLRGIADRPVWVSDPSAPKTDEGRGKLISDAMALQWEIVRSVDRRPQPLATTTLWMEGALLHKQGHLKFPADVTVIFSDNSPGWQLQSDFYEVTREPGRNYGVYYHHALWGSGPHLVQGVSPQRTYGIFREAVERRSNSYAILNVSNVREFALGVDASARLLRDFDTYDPDRFLKAWCDARFAPVADEARACYEKFFASYVLPESAHGRGTLDGETIHAGKAVFRSILASLQGKPAPQKKGRKAPAKPAVDHSRDYGTIKVHDQKSSGNVSLVQRQRAAVDEAGTGAPAVLARLGGAERNLFESNFVAQQRMMLGLLKWLESGLLAAEAHNAGNRAQLAVHVAAAEAAIAEIRAAQGLATQGSWEAWYRGERKMNIAEAEQLTRDVSQAVKGQ